MPDSGLNADTALNTAKSLLPEALASVAQTGDTQYRSVPWTLKQNSKDRTRQGQFIKSGQKKDASLLHNIWANLRKTIGKQAVI